MIPATNTIPIAVEACTIAYHERLKRDARTFRSATVPAGFMEDGNGKRLELRRCRRCGSSLGRQVR